MRKLFLLPLLFLPFAMQAQKFSRVKIDFDPTHTFQVLAQTGIDAEHGQHQPGRFFIGEFSENELMQIQQAGFSTTILVDDLKARLLELNRQGAPTDRSMPPCNPASDQVQTPANYTYGTMAGYYKYQELLDILDTMASLYPNLFKAREPITTAYTTFEGRPVYWVKISDNPDDDEGDEPEIFFNSVIHAREPNAMSQMIFFMWHLLENYETDEEIKYLLDHTEIYFVPLINPDGYIYNETTNPDGGGFWRKNRRINDDGSIGVDLNRNYGYQWGYDDNGSSPNPQSEVYRGTAPFSEPETQMIRDFCAAHEFQMAFNYHTYSNLMLHSWDYEFLQTPDYATFEAFSEVMTQENHYEHGISGEVLYLVNGGANDWMYGDVTTKPKILSWVPEVGPSNWGFWPPQFAIDQLNKDAFSININALRLLHNYGILRHSSSHLISSLDGQLPFQLKKMGLEPGTLTVSLKALTNNIDAVSGPQEFNLANLEETTGVFDFTLDPSIQDGDTARFELLLDNGDFAWRQTIEKIYTVNSQEIFFEPGDDLAQWEDATDWEATTATFYSAPSSITDSESGDYLPQSSSLIQMQDPVQLKDASNAYLSFWAKWDIEEDKDYAQLLVSVNGSNYFPLCGKYTESGTFEQDYEQPVYDGLQAQWVQEEIDLTEYTFLEDSVDLAFAFQMVSDNFIEADGFYFDNLTLTIITDGSVSSTTRFDESHFSMSSRPNPAGAYAIIDLTGDVENLEQAKLHVFNAFGQEVHQQPVQGKLLRIDTADWTSGVYFYCLSENGNKFPCKRMVVSKR